MRCALCIYDYGRAEAGLDPAKARTVMGGTAVCDEHIEYISDPAVHRFLRMREDERKHDSAAS